MITRKVNPPTDEQVAETVAELDRLGVRVTATLAEARAVLRNAGSGVSTDRLRRASNQRKAAVGLTPRNSVQVSGPSAEALAATIEQLDRFEVPVQLTGVRAQAALADQGLTVGRPRVDAAQRVRRKREGLSREEIRERRAEARSSTATELALSVLIDPRLFGAACVGRHELFDADLDGEPRVEKVARHERAMQICARCPVFAACDEVASENLRSVAGVWAGRVRTNPRSTKGVTP